MNDSIAKGMAKTVCENFTRRAYFWIVFIVCGFFDGKDTHHCVEIKIVVGDLRRIITEITNYKNYTPVSKCNSVIGVIV